ncbi:MAG: DUF302 domain-containing protein [Candidatus Thermoplasmatota archaeon]|nr:DUF302 domain-containing protein [Candidatus Thermoplasmatota archaeon]
MNEMEIVSEMGFKETVESLRKSIEENGLKIVSAVDAQSNLRRIGVEIGGNQILEVFHPALAKEVFEHDLRAGIVPPLRIYIFEDGGKTHVMAQSAVYLFSPYSGLENLARKLDMIMESILRSVPQ